MAHIPVVPALFSRHHQPDQVSRPPLECVERQPALCAIRARAGAADATGPVLLVLGILLASAGPVGRRTGSRLRCRARLPPHPRAVSRSLPRDRGLQHLKPAKICED